MNKKPEIIDKNSWLRDVDVYRQIETYIKNQQYSDVEVFDVVGDAEKFHDTISQALDKKHRNEAHTRYIIPFAKNANHFVNVIIDLKDPNQIEALYYDPKGYPIPEDLEVTIISMFDNVNLRALTTEQQTNSDDCGIYTPLNAEIFANTDLDFDYFEKHQDALFVHLDEAQMIERRKHVTQVLNVHYPGEYYYRDQKPSVTQLEKEIEDIDNELKNYEKDLNQKFWDLIKETKEFDQQEFETTFDQAVETYQEFSKTQEHAKTYGKSSDYNAWMGFFKEKNVKLDEQISTLALKPKK